jgi:energy-coupling factor transport system permease protein
LEEDVMPERVISFLGRISPIAQLLTIFGLLIPVFLSFDPYTPLPFLVIAILQILVLGRVPVKRMLKVILPLSALPAGLFVMNLFFSQPVEQETYHRVWFFSVSQTGLHRALVVGIRSLTLIVISISFILATDPLALINALMQQMKFSPRFGFGLYVAWNTIPFLRSDLRRIENAHRIRLRARRRSFREALPVAITLLAGAIRHAERASISMTARGLESLKPGTRSFLNESRWRSIDSIYLVVFLSVVSTVFVLIIRSGLFVFGLG